MALVLSFILMVQEAFVLASSNDLLSNEQDAIKLSIMNDDNNVHATNINIVERVDFYEYTGLNKLDELKLWEDEKSLEENNTEEYPEPNISDEEISLMSASTVKTYSKSAHGSTYLSKNFKVSEFACNDGSDTILIDSELVTILQNIRDHFGTAVTITSAYRTASYNAKVGGASNSYHVKGMAADIKVSGVTPADVAKYAETIGVRGVGRYNTFVHVDSRPSKYYWRNSGSSNVSVSTHGGTFNAYPYGSSTPSSVKNPEGVIDSCSGGSGSVSVRGWAFDRDDTGTSIPIHVYIGGPAGSSNAEGYEITANVLREDVNNVYGVGNYHGYDAKINTNKTGNQDVYIYACNIGSGENVLLGSRTVNITPRASELKYWLSASDMGAEITECEVGGTYYLCYKMHDANTGDYFNSYSSELYTVKLTFYDIDGTEIGSQEFTNTDRGSVQFVTTAAGTCSYKVAISGDVSGEAMVSFVIKDTTPQTYQITYNANGGQNAPASQTKTENVDLTLTTQKPTRIGYEFFGWGKTATTNTASYSSGGTYKENKSTTLYAVWVPVQYIVKYNANGGSGSMNTQLHIYDISKNLYTNTFTRTNYIFNNWNTKADGSGISYSDGTLVKNLSATKGSTFNLYAQWIKKYIDVKIYDYGTYKLCNVESFNIQTPYFIIVSSYKNNKLVSIEMRSSSDNNPFILLGDIDKVKVMVWKDFKTLIPLCESEEITSNNFIKE
ncbi:MAG: InlB B-repeat-containing protein [Clostridia bacterium]|nr:InlB B-repeat-containing protein [Clostridia bacterium]